MKDTTIKIIEVKSKGFVAVCPHCDSSLKPARSPTQAKWNLKVHILSKHQNESKEGLDGEKEYIE